MNLRARRITDPTEAQRLYEFGRDNYAPNFQACEGSPPYATLRQIERCFANGNIIIGCYDDDTGEMVAWRINGRLIVKPPEPFSLWVVLKIGDQGGYGETAPDLSIDYGAHMMAASWKELGKVIEPQLVDPQDNPRVANAQQRILRRASQLRAEYS